MTPLRRISLRGQERAARASPEEGLASQPGGSAARFEPGFLLFVAAAALFMPAVLLLDDDGWMRQGSLGVATAAFVWFFGRRSGVPVRQILTAILVATAGEIVLSLGWKLYSYQHALIPLYVPPGHGLFYALAASSARQPALRFHERAITRTVLFAGSVMALVSLMYFADAWGMLWWLGALALIARSRNQLLLATCFVYTIILEWGGTAIGNWTWAATVPFVGLQSANPPSGVGILYILLDLIVVWVASRVAPRKLSSNGPAPALHPGS